MKNKTIKELIKIAMIQLQKFKLAEGTMNSYRSRAFHTIEMYYVQKNMVFYDDALTTELKKIYQSQFNAGEISATTYNWRLRGLAIIAEIYQTGSFKWKVFGKNQKERFSVFFEDILDDFMKSLGTLKRKPIYESITRRFIKYLIKHNYGSFTLLSGQLVRNFLIEISFDKPKSMDDVITILRRFFQYLEENGIAKNPCYSVLAAPRSRGRKVYPSITVEEFNRTISYIDLSSSPGKRDYAILMLAATTGLRAGDIASLKLSNINWNNNEICFVQGKTKEILTLPLNKTTGSAIANYILHERPISDSENIFLRSCAPYERLHDGVSIACIFRRRLKVAGIVHKTGDGKTMNGIRRMLATEMTIAGITVTTVSQILGHKGRDAVKQYLSLDLKGLRKCTLGFDSLGGALK